MEDNILRNWMNTRFLHTPCSQMAVDFIIWEHILNNCCQANGQILELGTLRAGFSIFLCLQAIQRGKLFRTFDNYNFVDFKAKTEANSANPYGFNTPLGKLIMEGCFIEEDVLSGGAILESWIMREGQTILFCDNGLKPMEVKRYAPVLKPGDILAVHDWGTEIDFDDMPVCMRIIEPELLELRGMTAFFCRM